MKQVVIWFDKIVESVGKKENNTCSSLSFITSFFPYFPAKWCPIFTFHCNIGVLYLISCRWCLSGSLVWANHLSFNSSHRYQTPGHKHTHWSQTQITDTDTGIRHWSMITNTHTDHRHRHRSQITDNRSQTQTYKGNRYWSTLFVHFGNLPDLYFFCNSSTL